MARDVRITIEIKTGGARKEVKNLEGDVGDLDSTSVAAGASIKKSFGTILKSAAGLVSTALIVHQLRRAIAGAVDVAVRYETALTQVAKTTGLSRQEIKLLGQEITGLAARLGVSQFELAEIAATAGQLGIQGTSDILAFTETVAKLSSVTELTADQASEQIARIANSFNLPIDQAELLGSVLNELSNTTTAKAGDISDGLSRIGTAGSTIGITVDQAAALVSVLIDAGIESRRAGTSLRNTFIRMQTEADELGAVVGVTGEEFSSMVEEDALGALRAYLDGLREMEPALAAVKIKEVFGDENFLAVQTLSSQTELLNKNLATSNQAFAEGTSLGREFAVAMGDVSKQWDVLRANIEAFATAAGSRALPFFFDLLSAANDLLGGVDRLAEGVERLRESMSGMDEAERLLATYEELAGKTNRTAEESQQLRKVTDQLASRFPSMVKGYDDLGRVTGVYADSIARAVEQERALLRLRESERLADLGDEFEGAVDQLERLSASRDRLNQRIAAGEGGAFVQGIGTVEDQLDLVRESAATTEQEMAKMARQVSRLFDPDVSTRQLMDELDISAVAAARLGLALRAIARAREEALGDPDGGEGPPTGGGGGGGAPELAAELQRDIEAARVAVMQEGIAKRIAAVDLAIDQEIQAAREKYAEEHPKLFAELEQLLLQQREQLRRKVTAVGTPVMEPNDIVPVDEFEEPLRLLDGSIASINEHIADMQRQFDQATTQEARDEIAALIRELERARGLLQRTKEESTLTFQQIADVARQAAGVVRSAFQAAHQARMNQIERERKAALGSIDDKLKGERLSEHQRTKLLEERNALEEQFRQKQKQAQQEQARRQKLISLFEIAINTASAIAEALPNIPLAAIVGGLGAAQAAVVASTPVPEFRRGGDNVGGLVKVHEDEIIALPEGSNVISQNNSRRIAQALERPSAAAGGFNDGGIRADLQEIRSAIDFQTERMDALEVRFDMYGFDEKYKTFKSDRTR